MCLFTPPFGCAPFGDDRVVLCCRVKLVSECVGSEGSWEGLICRPRSVTACDWSEVTDKSYRVINGRLLPVLDLMVCVRGHAEN